jgi:hypothetical protein
MPSIDLTREFPGWVPLSPHGVPRPLDPPLRCRRPPFGEWSDLPAVSGVPCAFDHCVLLGNPASFAIVVPKRRASGRARLAGFAALVYPRQSMRMHRKVKRNAGELDATACCGRLPT